MTDDIWIQLFILLSGEFMQTGAYSTAPKYLPRLEVHITRTIYDVMQTGLRCCRSGAQANSIMLTD